MEDGQGFIGIVMDAHRGLDEVGPQRALRQLQGEAVVAHGVVVADDALFLDAEAVAPDAAGSGTKAEPGWVGLTAKRALWAGR